MKNYVQPGNSLSIPAPAGGAVAGAPCSIGSLRGFYAASAPEGQLVEVPRVGVFDVVKAAAEAWGIGDKLYYNAANSNFTKTSAGAVLFGFVAAPALAADVKGVICLGDTL